MTKFLNISTDNTLGGNSPSDVAVSSQKAVKAYVDGKQTLSGLTDVTISNPTAGQNLTYDATNQVWKNTSTSATVAWGGITGTMLDQTDLKNALDAKYDASNPNGYTSNVGTVTSVNNVSPVNGNVTISIPSEVTESTVSGWGFTKNTGTVTSVNSVSPVNGNVSLSIPKVSDTYSATSSNAMSGKAVASAVSGYVPTSRTVNGKALSSNISLSASDVGALPDSTVIPTVNNATLTIQKNGTTVKTFTANASSNVTANITVPTKVSDLTNDSGFISGITSSDVTTALGYTPYDSTNPSGYQANVIETVKVNGTALTPSSKAVDITVPAAQVNSDWNASSGVAQILNKPSLATVATSGSYNDLSNKPTIPTVNNATLTITQGGTTKGTFTANASSNVTIDLDSGGSVDVDNKSITTNSSDEIQTVGVIDSNNTTNAIKTWTGTKAQYDAIVTKDSNTLYNITDDQNISLSILELLYPVGSIYITTAEMCPLSSLISGSTWVLVSSGRVLQGADSGHSAGSTVEAGLPNITSTRRVIVTANGDNNGCITNTISQSNPGHHSNNYDMAASIIDASGSSSIYGNSSTVQPPAYIVNIYRRVL